MMNTASFNPDVVVAAIIGFIIGALLVGIISYSSRKKVKPEDDPTLKELHALQKKYDQYRAKVNEHFAKTADGIDSLTRSYQKVFEHLSHGAQDLMDKQALQAQLEKRRNKAVTLAYLVEQGNTESAPVRQESHNASTLAKPAPTSPTTAASIKQTPAAKPALTGKPAETVAKPAQLATKPAPAAAMPAVGSNNEATVKPVSEVNKPASVTAGSAKKPIPAAASGKSQQPKSNVHIAAEKAGLKPITKATDKQESNIIQNKEHETAIESIKKHIKQEIDEGNTK